MQRGDARDAAKIILTVELTVERRGGASVWGPAQRVVADPRDAQALRDALRAYSVSSTFAGGLSLLSAQRI